MPRVPGGLSRCEAVLTLRFPTMARSRHWNLVI